MHSTGTTNSTQQQQVSEQGSASKRLRDHIAGLGSRARPLLAALAMLAGCLVYGLSLTLTLRDPQLERRWLVFFLWLGAVVVWGEALWLGFGRISWSKPSRRDYATLLSLAGLAVITRFVFLSIYPYVSIGDELRDGGLDGINIANGAIKNIFSYGRYNSHGFIIPTISSAFFPLVGRSVLMYRVPAALIAIGDILLLYACVKRLVSYRMAVLAAIMLLCLPLHLFYARTEIVVILSSFWTTAILGMLGFWQRERSLRTYGILGLVLGFAAGFHASMRPVIFLTLILVAILSGRELWRGPGRRALLVHLGIFALAILIGFGPRLLFSSPQILFHTARVPTLQQAAPQGVVARLEEALNKYPRSLLVYLYEGTTTRYPPRRPIFPFMIGCSVVIGLAAAVLRGPPFLRLVAIYALAIPFTNSALTNVVNADHRLAPLFPISCLLASYGVLTLFDYLRRPAWSWRLSAYGMLAGVLVSNGIAMVNFYDREYASFNNFTLRHQFYQDYIPDYVVRAIALSPALQAAPGVCLTTSKENKRYLDIIHNREQFTFFLPNTYIRTHELDGAGPFDIYVARECLPSLKGTRSSGWQAVRYCQQYKPFICPPDRKQLQVHIHAR